MSDELALLRKVEDAARRLREPVGYESGATSHDLDAALQALDDWRAASAPKTAAEKFIGHMTDAEIDTELKQLGERWDASRDDEGHGGSPGEWMVERMSALETEQKRRAHEKAGLCAYPTGCNRKRLRGLSMCPRHQPYPAR